MYNARCPRNKAVPKIFELIDRLPGDMRETVCTDRQSPIQTAPGCTTLQTPSKIVFDSTPQIGPIDALQAFLSFVAGFVPLDHWRGCGRNDVVVVGP